MIDIADGNAVLHYYHFDRLGSVIALSDVNSVIVERYSSDVFGEPNRTSDVNNPYLFTGRRYDSETGLYYYRARYYAYDIGRFLQTDPVGYSAGLNLYSYCSNNPVTFSDPTGLIPKGNYPLAVLRIRPNALLRVRTGDGKTKSYKVTDATDIVKVMIKSKVTDNPIIEFEYIGHGDATGGVLSVARKKNDMGQYHTGIFIFGETRSNVYTMDSLKGLIKDSFDPQAKIVLAACCTAFNTRSGNIGEAFKKILPEAEVWGYTGIVEIDTLWGLHHPKERTNSEFVKIELPKISGCQK